MQKITVEKAEELLRHLDVIGQQELPDIWYAIMKNAKLSRREIKAFGDIHLDPLKERQETLIKEHVEEYNAKENKPLTYKSEDDEAAYKKATAEINTEFSEAMKQEIEIDFHLIPYSKIMNEDKTMKENYKKLTPRLLEPLDEIIFTESKEVLSKV